MNFVIKKTFCYEPLAEALSILSKNVIIWDDTVSLKQIINSYTDLCFFGIYDQCRPSTLRMLKSYNIKSFLITSGVYKIDDENCTILNLLNKNDANKRFYKERNIRYLECFWPFHKLDKLKHNDLYASDLAFIYDCDYSKMMKNIIPHLENNENFKITTWGNPDVWPWIRHNGLINEYNMCQIITSSKKIGLPENADKRYIIKTLCHGGTPALFNNDFKEIDFDKTEYEQYNSNLFLKSIGEYLC
jgi:hypothetical protein